MTQLRRYRYQAYPDGGQRRALARAFGCARVVFNDFLAERDRLYEAGEHKSVPFGDTARLVTTLAKHTPERSWLGEVSAVVLQQSVRDATRAYSNFFDSLTGKRKGRRVGRPRFRRRGHRQSVRLVGGSYRVLDTPGSKWGKVRLSKIGDLRFRRSRPLPSTPSSVTIIQEPDGTYWVSFVVTAPTPTPVPVDAVAALDLGLTDLAAVVSVNPTTGAATRSKVANPRHLRRAQRKLARLQRSLSRKQRGSANRAKARVKVARAHRRVRQARADLHHKLAHQLVASHAVIVLETLALIGMGRSRLAKSVHDAGLGYLIDVITDKAENQGRTILRINQWEPTTQTCAVCGTRGGPKPLNVREWTCNTCGTQLDRDYNAAVNIMLAAGLAESLNACGGDIRRTLATVSDAAPVKQEPTEQTKTPCVSAA